jgi:hypothetical protein
MSLAPGLLFRKTSTCRARGAANVAQLDLDYLDETSAVKNGGHVQKSVNYLTKEELGAVHCGGFLHSRLLAMTEPGEPGPVHLPNHVRKERIVQACREHIMEHAKPDGVIAHRCILSMSKSMRRRLEHAGLHPDAVLQASLKKIMRKVQDRFHPGDAIGYCYGIHHDTEHLHLHVFLLAHTAKGNRLGLSEQLRRKRLPSRHRNQMRRIKEWIAAEEAHWNRVCADPAELEKLARRRDGERFFFAPESIRPARDKRYESPTEMRRARQRQHRMQSRYRLAQDVLKAQRAARSASRIVRYRHRLLMRPPHLLLAFLSLLRAFRSKAYTQTKNEFLQARRDHRPIIKRKKTHAQSSSSRHPHWQKVFGFAFGIPLESEQRRSTRQV